MDPLLHYVHLTLHTADSGTAVFRDLLHLCLDQFKFVTCKRRSLLRSGSLLSQGKKSRIDTTRSEVHRPNNNQHPNTSV